MQSFHYCDIKIGRIYDQKIITFSKKLWYKKIWHNLRKMIFLID